MKGPIERFDLTTEDNDLGHARGVMESDPKGDYVSFEDHDRIVTELKAEIARQAKVIEKLKTMVSHYETCSTVDKYDDEVVLCDCGLEKELEAVEQEEDVEK